MIGFVFGLKFFLCVHTYIDRQAGFFFLGGFAQALPGVEGVSWAGKCTMDPGCGRHFVPFNVFDAGDPPRLGGQLGECTACCAEHHPIFVPRPKAPRLPRALECPNLGSRGARRANGLSTLETGTIANTSNMHVAFALLALLGITVTQRLRTTLIGTGKTPTVTVCLSLQREEAMLMNSPFTLGTGAGDPTKLAAAAAAIR